MNILTNICNPKEQHFEQQARTQAYKPINDYIFENRSMQRMRTRHQPIQNPEEYRYKSWNHPYSISNFFMTQKDAINGQDKQSLGANAEYINYQNQLAHSSEQRNENKKISFKQIPQRFCGIGKEDQQGQKLFTKRQDFYTSLRSNEQINGKGGFAYQGRNYGQENSYQIQNDNTRFSRIQHLQNDPISSQNSHTYIVLSQEILRLKQQNKQLKRTIEEEYKPMKELYNKLLSEQQERQYLISKLEWKVKELVKEMGTPSGSFGTVIKDHLEQNHNIETKTIPKVDSEKQLAQTSIPKPFNTFQTNFTNIKMPQNKHIAYSSLQSRYKNVNSNSPNESKQFGQFKITPSNANNNYQRNSTQQNSQHTFNNPQYNTQQLNTQPYQSLGNLQQNHYGSIGSNNFVQKKNISLQSNSFGHYYQKPMQNFQINPSFNQNTGYQTHYQPVNARANH